MKNCLKILALAVAAALTLSSCDKEVEEAYPG